MSDQEPVICIIDDSRAYREICRGYLAQDSDYHYRVFEEETGTNGLKLCQTLQPDCILLDYDLPDITGLKFLTELAANTSSHLVPFPVVMLTSSGNEHIALQAMKSGAQDYLVKSEMTAGNLYRAIHNAIERSSMRRLVEEQGHSLEQKNQELQTFAYALAHDLKAPLRAIRGFAELVNEEYNRLLDATGQHYLQTIIKSTTQMNELIDDLLSYSQIEHRPVRFQPVELMQLVSEVVKGFAEESGHISVQEAFPSVCGDTTLITQALLNLLDNALKYHKPGLAPEVSITCQLADQSALLCIADKGIGVDRQHHEKIFHIFQRLHGDDEYPGSGIGLAIVKKSIERMHGKIWLTSEVGKGTCFYVQLPLCG